MQGKPHRSKSPSKSNGRRRHRLPLRRRSPTFRRLKPLRQGFGPSQRPARQRPGLLHPHRQLPSRAAGPRRSVGPAELHGFRPDRHLRRGRHRRHRNIFPACYSRRSTRSGSWQA